MKDPRGRDLVHRLAADADAFVDVYRPGVAERLGIGPDALRERNPRLVYARMTGYGQDGPLAGHAGHDINYIALTGALHGIGTAESPLPPLNLVGDYGGGGMLLAVGLLSAILEARESGEGQVLDVAMVDGVATLLAPYFGMVPEGTWRDRREDNLLDGAAHFYGAYATADGRHVAVGAMEPKFYAELCDRLGVDVPHDDDQPAAWAAHRADIGRAFRRKDPRRVGTDPRFAGMLCDTGAFAVGGAAAPASGRARNVHRHRRRHPTGARAALLANTARGTHAPVAAGRPYAYVAARAWDSKTTPSPHSKTPAW